MSGVATASEKNVEDSHVFSATIPDYGVYVPFKVHFRLTGEYDDNSTSYYLDKFSVCAYIDPKYNPASGLGNGNVTGTIDETIDYASSTSRDLLFSKGWTDEQTITNTTTLIYFHKSCQPNKTFRYAAQEKGTFAFAYGDCLVHNYSHMLSLDISGPR